MHRSIALQCIVAPVSSALCCGDLRCRFLQKLPELARLQGLLAHTSAGVDTDWALKESERVAERDSEDFLVGVTVKKRVQLGGICSSKQNLYFKGNQYQKYFNQKSKTRGINA